MANIWHFELFQDHSQLTSHPTVGQSDSQTDRQTDRHHSLSLIYDNANINQVTIAKKEHQQQFVLNHQQHVLHSPLLAWNGAVCHWEYPSCRPQSSHHIRRATLWGSLPSPGGRWGQTAPGGQSGTLEAFCMCVQKIVIGNNQLKEIHHLLVPKFVPMSKKREATHVSCKEGGLNYMIFFVCQNLSHLVMAFRPGKWSHLLKYRSRFR